MRQRKQVREWADERRIYEIAAYEENKVLIVGAFGCGAFRNPPELVAEAFRKVSEEYRHSFETLEFAIYCSSYETNNYQAFRNFDIDACAAMTDEELENLLSDTGLIRNRGKIFSVRKNAQVVKKIQEEYGSFDAYLWSFTDGKVIDGHWKDLAEMPTESDVSRMMSADMKKRGIGFVGPVITYSFLQSIGIVNDHLEDCRYR